MSGLMTFSRAVVGIPVICPITESAFKGTPLIGSEPQATSDCFVSDEEDSCSSASPARLRPVDVTKVYKRVNIKPHFYERYRIVHEEIRALMVKARWGSRRALQQLKQIDANPREFSRNYEPGFYRVSHVALDAIYALARLGKLEEDSLKYVLRLASSMASFGAHGSHEIDAVKLLASLGIWSPHIGGLMHKQIDLIERFVMEEEDTPRRAAESAVWKANCVSHYVFLWPYLVHEPGIQQRLKAMLSHENERFRECAKVILKKSRWSRLRSLGMTFVYGAVIGVCFIHDAYKDCVDYVKKRKNRL